jgi:hypothetical protein
VNPQEQTSKSTWGKSVGIPKVCPPTDRGVFSLWIWICNLHFQNTPRARFDMFSFRCFLCRIIQAQGDPLGHLEQYLMQFVTQAKRTPGTSSSTSYPRKYKPSTPRAPRAAPHAIRNTSQKHLGHLEQLHMHFESQAKSLAVQCICCLGLACTTTCLELGFADSTCPCHLSLLGFLGHTEPASPSLNMLHFLNPKKNWSFLQGSPE